MATYYYHLRCGGQLVNIGLDDGAEYYRCHLCEERGYPFVESWVEDEDREKHSDLFNMLPTTFIIDDKTLVVCGLIPNAKDGNRWINDLLNTARKQDAERGRVD